MRPPSDVDLPLAVDRAAATPIAAQLAEQLRAAVSSGLLLPGEPVPPSRVLARRLGVARGTVLAAYQQLDGEGYLHARRGSATTISPELPASARGARAPAGDPGDRPGPPAAQTFPQLDSSKPGGTRPTGTRPTGTRPTGTRPTGTRPTGTRPTSTAAAPLDLRPGRPETDGLAYAAWRTAWRRAAARSPSGYDGPAEGVQELRSQVEDHLRRVRGLVAHPDDVLVTAGVREGLGLVVQGLAEVLGRPPCVAVEDPGYPSARRVLSRQGATLLPVPVDDEGLVVAALPRGAAAPDAVLVTPSHQYPLGGRMPVHRRLELLRWAHQHDAVVLEDDYDSEFRHEGLPLPALASLDDEPGHRGVVHLGTFSKVVTSELRAGWLVCPDPALQRALVAVRRDLGCPVAVPVQHAVAELMVSGALRRHVARARRTYRRRRDLLVAALAGESRVTSRALDGGLHAVLELPPGTDAAEVVRRAAGSGVLVSDLADYRVAHGRRAGPSSAVVLGYGAVDDDDLRRAVAVVLAALPAR